MEIIDTEKSHTGSFSARILQMECIHAIWQVLLQYIECFGLKHTCRTVSKATVAGGLKHIRDQ